VTRLWKNEIHGQVEWCEESWHSVVYACKGITKVKRIKERPRFLKSILSFLRKKGGKKKNKEKVVIRFSPKRNSHIPTIMAL